METFEAAHRRWFDAHWRSRDGRRRKALERGHGPDERSFLENVWWPLFRHFDGLHPQRETRDDEGARRTIDFAYVAPPLTVWIEIGAPCRERVPRLWPLLRFSADEVERDAARCRRSLLRCLAWLDSEAISPAAAGLAIPPLPADEREVVRLAARRDGIVTPADVASALSVSGKTARALLKRLVDKRVLEPAGAGRRRVRAYRPAMEPRELFSLIG